MKAFQAVNKHGKRTATTPRVAALSLFSAYPNARKCDVYEGETDGQFFTRRLQIGVGSGSRRWLDVSARAAAKLPEE